MAKWALAISASAVAAQISAARAAPILSPPLHASRELHHLVSAVPGSVLLYEQSDEDSGVAVISSTDDDVWSEYSSYGADDFAVPVGHKWRVTQIDVSGIYVNGSGPAYSETVTFYKDKNGLPGRLIAKCDKVVGADNAGSFSIKLPKSCRANLKGGNTYWVSVAANLTWNFYGIWEWETRNGQNGNSAAWQNPGGGFERCLSWDVMTSCIGDYGEGPDFMFALKGKDEIQ